MPCFKKKFLCIAILMLTAGVVYAQQGSVFDVIVEKMKSSLDLNDKQVSEIQSILASTSAESQELLEEFKEHKANQPEVQAQIDKINSQKMDKILQLLSPEQLEKFRKLNTANKSVD